MGVFVAVESSIHGDPGGQTCDRLDDLIGCIVKEHAGDEQGEVKFFLIVIIVVLAKQCD